LILEIYLFTTFIEMPPKKTSTGAAAAKKEPEHPAYKDMITSAISTVSPSPNLNPYRYIALLSSSPCLAIPLGQPLINAAQRT
jgi:hypothetical protein